MKNQICTILGGGGFIGKYLVRNMTKKNYRCIITTRKAFQKGYLKTQGTPGSVELLDWNPNNFSELKEAIRNSDIVINLTAGMGGDWVPDQKNMAMPGDGTDMIGPDERLEHVELCKPEICSLDCGTLNFGVNDHSIYISTLPILRKMAELTQSWGVKPELEVFDLGHIRLAKQLISEKLVNEPPMFQICLGIPWGADQSVDTMKVMKDHLPQNAFWSGFGISRMQIPMATAAVAMGGNVRVGLEDNLYLSKGVLATNAQLVEKIVKIINIDVDRIGRLVTVIAMCVKNRTTNGFDSPPVKKIIKAN